jgi:uncharacterized membrane protein
MRNDKTRRLVLAALLAALVCVSTLVIRIPSPTNGYINLGDCFVLLSAWLLSPAYAAAAAGLGAAIADLSMGYAYFAPATLVIKALMGCTAALIYRALPHKRGMVLGAVLAEAEMVALYFLFTALLLGRGSAAALSIPGNLLQGAVGAVIAVVLMGVVKKSGLEKRLPHTTHHGRA